MLRASDEENSQRDFMRKENTLGRIWTGFTGDEIIYSPNTTVRSHDGYKYPRLLLKFKGDKLLRLTYSSGPSPADVATLFYPNAWIPLSYAIKATEPYYKEISAAVESVHNYWDSQ